MSFINTYNEARQGALKISKLVKINGNDAAEDQYSLVDRDYTFMISGPASAEEADQITKYVKITVQNGQMASYKVADTDTEAAWSAAEALEGTWALVGDLAAGDYVITEAEAEGMTVSSITGGKQISGENDADITDRTITVQVTAGDTAADDAQAQVVFTNNLGMTSVKVLKVDQNNQTAYLEGAAFEL